MQWHDLMALVKLARTTRGSEVYFFAKMSSEDIRANDCNQRN